MVFSISPSNGQNPKDFVSPTDVYARTLLSPCERLDFKQMDRKLRPRDIIPKSSSTVTAIENAPVVENLFTYSENTVLTISTSKRFQDTPTS